VAFLLTKHIFTIELKQYTMKDFIHIQDGTGGTHVIFTRHITNLTLHGGAARIHINSGGSSMTVQTKLSIRELLDIISDKPDEVV